jgi:F-type H+-transporting ATPase subunit delta
MTAISNNEIARAIFSLSKGKSHSEQLDISKKAVNFLFRKRMLSKSGEILSQLGKIVNQDEGRIIAKVSSVEPLKHQMKTNLEHALKKRYGAEHVVLTESIDPSLIGGLKVEVNNEVIDLSIKNKIKKLQEHLTKSA